MPGIGVSVGLGFRSGRGGPAAPAMAPTFDPANKSASVTLTEGNALMTSADGDRGVKSVRSNTAGKRYFEVQMGAPGIQGGIGIATAVETVDTWVGSSGNSIGLDTASGDVYMTSGPKGSAGLGAIAAADVIGVAVDFTAGLIWFSKNGVFASGQVPASGTGGFVFAGSPQFVMVSANGGGAFRLRIDAALFSGAMPAGYTSWSA